jgi:hypothetical protein
VLSIARSSPRSCPAAEIGHQQFSYPTASRSLTVLTTALQQIDPMNAERAAFFDQLKGAIDAGDRKAAGILPMFRNWLTELAQGPEAAKHELGSMGFVARMFALRELAETTS